MMKVVGSFETGGPENAIQGTDCYLDLRMRDGDPSRLHRMFEVVVTSSHSNQLPTICLK